MQNKTIKTKYAENELSQNTHLIEFENSCIVIDAGCPIDNIRALSNKPIRAVFITHGHFDHIKCIKEYEELGVPIYANKSIRLLLNDECYNVSQMFNQSAVYDVKGIEYVLDDEIIIDGHKIKCIYTPGHSIDSTCYLVDDKYLCSGDTLFSVSIGRFDLPTSSKEQLLDSLIMLQNVIYEQLLAGHGRTSTKQEQDANIAFWIEQLNKNNL